MCDRRQEEAMVRKEKAIVTSLSTKETQVANSLCNFRLLFPLVIEKQNPKYFRGIIQVEKEFPDKFWNN